MRRALLIATDTYRDPTFSSLRAPRLDAAELDTVLGNPAIGDFTTEVLVNQPVQHLRERIETVLGQAVNDDFVLIYISGHGVKARFGDLHFVTTDTRNSVLATTSLDAAFVRRQIDDSLAGQIAVWLDCCYGGAFPSGLLPRATEDIDVVHQLNQDGRGCAIMTASTHIQYAYEPAGDRIDDHAQPSVFTKAIIEGLRTGDADLDHDGEISARDLYGYVYDHVRRTNSDQTPTSSGTLSGDLRIAYAGTPLPAGLPDELRRLLRSTEPAFRLEGMRMLRDRAQTGDAIALVALHVLAESTDGTTSAAARELLTPSNSAAPTPTASTAAATATTATTATTGAPHTPAAVPTASTPTAATHTPPPARQTESSGSTARQPYQDDDLMAMRTALMRPVPEFRAKGVVGSGHLGVVFSHDSSMLASLGSIWRTDGWQIVYRVTGYGQIHAFSSDDRLVAVSDNNRLVVLSTETWDEVGVVPAASHLDRVIDFNHDGTLLAVTSLGTMTIFGNDGANWRALEAPMFHDAKEARFCPDSPRLAVAKRNGHIEVWDTVDWIRLGVTTLTDLEFIALRHGLLLAAASKDVIRVWRTDTWEIVNSTRLIDPALSRPIAFGPDLNTIMWCGEHGLEFRRVGDGMVTQTIPANVWQAALSGNGRFLAGLGSRFRRSGGFDVWIWTHERKDADGLHRKRMPPPPSVAEKNKSNRTLGRFGAVGGGVLAAVGVLVGNDWAMWPALVTGGVLATATWSAVNRIWIV